MDYRLARWNGLQNYTKKNNSKSFFRSNTLLCCVATYLVTPHSQLRLALGLRSCVLLEVLGLKVHTYVFNKFNRCRSVHLTCSKGVSSDVWQSGKGRKQLEQRSCLLYTKFIVHSIVHSSRAIRDTCTTYVTYTYTYIVYQFNLGPWVSGPWVPVPPVPGPQVHWI